MKTLIKNLLFSFFFLASFLILPKFASAATIYLNPSSGNYTAGSTITVNVLVNTENQAINAAEASIQFTSDILELVGVSQGTTFTLPAPGSLSKELSSAYVAGGLPSPGYTGSSGSLGQLVFRAKQEGSASINIVSGKALVNDGFGTNALSSTLGAKLNIGPTAVIAPVVSSSTHPDTTKWYSARNVEISWTRPSGASGFSFVLDQRPNTIPDNVIDATEELTRSYKDLQDGTRYFHIKARASSGAFGFSSTTHFAVNIDTLSPQVFEVKLLGGNTQDVTDQPTIEFATTDETSGVGSYNVYLDNRILQENATSPYTLEKIKGGSHIIKVVAYDKAGNERAVELSVYRVRTGFLHQMVSLPMWLVLIFSVLFFLMLIFVIWLILQRKLAHEVGLKLAQSTRELRREIKHEEEELIGDVEGLVRRGRRRLGRRLEKWGRKLQK